MTEPGRARVADNAPPMVLCVALNCGIDKVYDCRGFGLKGIHQPKRSVTCIGGKAVNQARTVRTLGIGVLVTGFAGGAVGEAARQQLRCEGIEHDFQPTQDESRLAITILDSATDTHTEVNEWGSHVSTAELAGWLSRYEELLGRASLVSFAGSAPPGVPRDIYRRTIAMARARGIDTMLDARGDWLRSGLEAGPDVVKPNQAELGELLGAAPRTLEETARAALALCARGVRQVVVTLGADGAVAARDGRAVHGRIDPVPAISAVGSGDALAGALAAGWVRGEPIEDALRRGIACGAASALRLGPAFVDVDEVQELCQRVRMTPLAV